MAFRAGLRYASSTMASHARRFASSAPVIPAGHGRNWFGGAAALGGCGLGLAALALQQQQQRSENAVRVITTEELPHGAIRVFSGNAHPQLAEGIADNLGVKLSGCTVSQFKNGETGVLVHESVRDCDVFIVQSTCNPRPNDFLMELLIMMDAIRRGGAARITAVVPLFGYARQDKKDQSRAPITAKLVADMLRLAGADRVITVDLHASQIQGFVNYPIDNLYAMPLLRDTIKSKLSDKGDGSDLVIVSPDAGGAKRAEHLAKKLNADLAIFSKKREKANEVAKMILVGEVAGKKCVIVDDMVDTGGTLTLAAKQLMEYGATEVYAACSHGVLSDPALRRINESPIKSLLLTDSIPLDDKLEICPKIEVVTIASLLADAIDRVHTGRSLSHLFDAKTKLKPKGGTVRS